MQERNPYRIPNDTTTISKKTPRANGTRSFFSAVFYTRHFFPHKSSYASLYFSIVLSIISCGNK